MISGAYRFRGNQYTDNFESVGEDPPVCSDKIGANEATSSSIVALEDVSTSVCTTATGSVMISLSFASGIF